MAQIKKEEIEREREIQKIIWNFRKEFYHGEDGDDYWKLLCDECERISRECNSLYIDQMLIVCIDDIEARFMQENGQAINPYSRLVHTSLARDALLDRYVGKA